MSTKRTQRKVNVAQTLASEWQLGGSGNSVTISIYDLDDNALDVDAVAMTNETGGLFSYSWTPTEEHTYRVDYFNTTLNSHNFEIVTVTDAISDMGSIYREVNVQALLANEWVLGNTTDTVKISIYDLDDNNLDVDAVAMTSETRGLFSYAWTPTEEHCYRIDYHNLTLGSHEYEMVAVVTPDASGSSSSSGDLGTGSTLSVLRSRFLRLIDNYNSNDLSGTNSSGDVADLCINDALQTIYSLIKSSRHTDAYSLTSLVSTADQAFINLSAISNIDEILAIKDTANQTKLRKITPEQYFMRSPDPASNTGRPIEYCRIFNRIYLNPRPTSAITYTTEYKKIYPNLSSDSSVALIPSKYDRWIMAEALVIWLMGEDPNATAAINTAQKERERCERIFMNDIDSHFDEAPQGASHFLDGEVSGRMFSSPIDGT